jgi:hypothetical protein
MKTPIESLKACVEIQCQDGNWDMDPYTLGMANGLILALHIMEETEGEVAYKEAPEKWIRELRNESRLILPSG